MQLGFLQKEQDPHLVYPLVQTGLPFLPVYLVVYQKLFLYQNQGLYLIHKNEIYVFNGGCRRRA